MADGPARPEVSVVVPVFNPGRRIDACIRSLRDQSLTASAYEVIFVDDGSTDATPARLDALAVTQENVRVHHIENSGWPGRPRNVGIEMARGDFVYFVDNDDWIGHETLERLHETAVRDQADIVIGKVVGHGKPVPRALFRRNRTGVGLDWEPLVSLLTPHKLWRREFLDAHRLRFPEGRRRLEDHVFVMRAFFQAPRISVLADYPYYHWVLWDAESNASWGALHSETYFTDMREVLDIIDEHTDPGPFRDRIHLRWYRGKVLNKIPKLRSNTDPERRLRVYENMRGLAVDRFGPGVDDLLPFNLQLRSRLLRAADYDELARLVEFESTLEPRIEAVTARVRRHRLELRFEAQLHGYDGALEFESDGECLRWSPPARLSLRRVAQEVEASRSVGKSTVQILLKHRTSREEYRVSAEVRRRLETSADGWLRVILSAEANVDATEAGGGAHLAQGAWDINAVVIVAGFRNVAAVPRTAGGEHLVLAVGPAGRIRVRRPAWQDRLRRRLPVPLLRAAVRLRRMLQRQARSITRGRCP